MGKRKNEVEAKVAEGNGSNEDDARLLGLFLQYHMEDRKDISFEVVAVDLDVHKSNNRWRAAWKSVKEKGLIEPATSGKGFQISESGIQSAETPEYREFLKDKNFVALTSTEHQERLKSRFKRKKSAAIFDLLLQHGSLTRYELAGLVGEKDRGHSFSYSLQELKKKKNLVENDPASLGRSKKLRLSDKAFLKPDDRPIPEKLDADVLAKAVADNGAPRSEKPKKSKNATKTNTANDTKAETDGEPTRVEDEFEDIESQEDAAAAAQTKEMIEAS